MRGAASRVTQRKMECASGAQGAASRDFAMRLTSSVPAPGH